MKIPLSPKQCKPLQFNAKFASLRFSSNLPHVSRFQAKIKGRTIKYLRGSGRSEEHTSELQSRQYLVCRLLLEKKKKNNNNNNNNLFNVVKY